MKQTLTGRYCLHQMAYWASAAGVISFASAFLLEKGFAPSQVGILLASGNFLSCGLQPLLADRADRTGGSILIRLTAGLTLLCMACFGTIQLLPLPQWLFGVLFLLGIFTFDAMMPLMNSISVSYNRSGRAINYGLCRGIGSLAFSMAALVIGKVMARFGGDWMIWIVVALLAVNMTIILGYPALDQAGVENPPLPVVLCVPSGGNAHGHVPRHDGELLHRDHAPPGRRQRQRGGGVVRCNPGGDPGDGVL